MYSPRIVRKFDHRHWYQSIEPKASRRSTLTTISILLLVILCNFEKIDNTLMRLLSNDSTGLPSGENLDRPLNILTLGGSTTWGVIKGSPSRDFAYPYLLESQYGHSVSNLAIRASGADYPSRCIESMIRDSDSHEDTKDFYEATQVFDVIVFEFSINGVDGFPILFKRLKERFPEALFIYADIHSLVHGSFNTKETIKLILDDGGFVYKFPTDNDLGIAELEKLYSQDKHHIGRDGHSLVANNIDLIIQDNIKSGIIGKREPRLGDWHEGDFCANWFGTGESPYVSVSGDAKMVKFDPNADKFAYEIGKGGAVFEFQYPDTNNKSTKQLLRSKKISSAGVSLTYMTKSDPDDQLKSFYPLTVVKVESTKLLTEEDKKVIEEGKLEVVRHEDTTPTGFEINRAGWEYIYPVNQSKGLRKFHIQDQKKVGEVYPGENNYIFVKPMESTRFPLRIVAISVCEAYERFKQELESSI